MKKTIYKITITNWDKYNGTLKKGHKSILLSTGFLTDAKIRTLPAGGKLLYLGLLLRCGEVTSRSIEASHDLLVTFAGGSGQVVSRLLDQLQTLQLVTYEKNTPFLIEKNRIEDNRIEKNIISGTGQPASLKIDIEKPLSTHRSRAAIRGCIDEFISEPTCVKYFSNCTHPSQKSWLEAYPSKDFIIQECKRSAAWIASNPQKAPKDFQRFFNSWLSRAFENYRKGLPSRPITNAEKNEMHLREMWDKNERGEL